MWWIATRKGLFRADDQGLTGPTFPGVPVSLVLVSGETVWAALDHGHFGAKMHRSRDGGQTFDEVAMPAFAPEDEAAVQVVWALERGGDGTLWCGTIPGGLFTSTDDGDSWTLVRSLWNRAERKLWMGGGADEPGIHSVCIHPDDPSDVVIGVSCGGVWRTRDGGSTWSLEGRGFTADFLPPDQASDPTRQDPHCIARSPTNPDILWCQHHCGVWRSEDAGSHWRRIEVPPSSFGFPVVVHPADPDTAWFVPGVADAMRIPVDGKLVVAKTVDAGQSFSVIRDGLPQEHAYDVVYRHALAIDNQGEHLCMGSTTGNVWASADGGLSWKTVSKTLPPVYAVIFAGNGAA